jgi:hypothetical protein
MVSVGLRETHHEAVLEERQLGILVFVASILVLAFLANIGAFDWLL